MTESLGSHHLLARDKIAILAWLRLARAFQKVERAGSEQMRQFGLSMGQFDVLAHVGAAQGITQTALAESLLVTKGNICQLIDRMEYAGLLRRQQQGRTNRVYLTERGSDLFDEAVPKHQCLVAGKFGALNADEQAQLLALLRKLDRALP